MNNRFKANSSIDTLIAPLKINRIDNLYIVNDSYLVGGTKSRVCYHLIKKLVKKGYREFIYVSPWNGAACIALMILLNRISNEYDIKLNGTVFIEDGYNELPPFINVGKSYGAKIISLPKNILMKNLKEYVNCERSMVCCWFRYIN